MNNAENIDIKTDFAHLNSHFTKFIQMNKWKRQGNGKIVHCSKYTTMVIVQYNNVMYTNVWNFISQMGHIQRHNKDLSSSNIEMQIEWTRQHTQKNTRVRINKTYESVLKRNKCEKHYAL